MIRGRQYKSGSLGARRCRKISRHCSNKVLCGIKGAWNLFQSNGREKTVGISPWSHVNGFLLAEVAFWRRSIIGSVERWFISGGAKR